MNCSYVGISAVALNAWFFTIFIALVFGVPKERTFAKVSWMAILIAFFLFEADVLKNIECVDTSVLRDAP